MAHTPASGVSDGTKIQTQTVQPARSRTWLAACRGWRADLFGRKPRKDVVKGAAATSLTGELLDRTLEHIDGC